MKNWKNSIARCLLAACAIAVMPIFTPALACPPQTAPQQAAQATSEREVGFLLAAPDRGFMGNEEIRDAFEAFRQQHNATLLVVTDGRTRENARVALATLASQGAKRVVLLPLFYSAGEARYAILRKALDGAGNLPLSWAPAFGTSYFAVEALAERLRAAGIDKRIDKGEGKQLIVVGSGAADQAGAERIGADLSRLARHASADLGYAGIAAAVWPDAKSANEEALRKAALATLHAQPGALVAQLHLGQKLDSMMSLSTRLKHTLPSDSRLLAEQPLTPLALTWMRREANRQLPLAPGQIGVVIAAHGSDWHWNETMQSAVRPLEQRYQVEYAFSMADAPVLERAVRRLEQRGVRAIVIVRVFGTKNSFKREIEHLIGQDIEAPPDQHAQHTGGHGSHGHGPADPVARISSAAVLSSAGGMEDHPLFAQALTERAKALSKDPRRSTVILTAHGTNDDAANAKWLEQLTSIAAAMKANMAAAGDAAFREIRVATWREDWPEKRAPWVERVRGWVEQGGRDGEVIVLAARTTGTGPEAELLAGLKFRLGSGFAPHPLFARWVEEQVQAGLNQRPPAASTSIASAATANTTHSAKQPQHQH